MEDRMNRNRLAVPRAISLAAIAAQSLALGVLCSSVEACGGVGPDGNPTGTTAEEKTGKAAQDFTIIGITLPQPTITVGLNDASVKIDPIGTIVDLLPPVVLPDPFQPVNQVLGALQDGGAVGVQVPGVTVGLRLPALPVPTIPDPFDGGIPLLVP
jgi:hypothetical protein